VTRFKLPPNLFYMVAVRSSHGAYRFHDKLLSLMLLCGRKLVATAPPEVALPGADDVTTPALDACTTVTHIHAV
jgi:hypothetical protein